MVIKKGFTNLLGARIIGSDLVFLKVIVCCLLINGCESYNDQSAQLVGRWQLFNQCGHVAQTSNIMEFEQRIEEYTSNNENISYDINLLETGRRKFKANGSMITIFGYGVDGKSLKFKFEYRVQDDTLRIRSDSGYGYIDEFYFRITK